MAVHLLPKQVARVRFPPLAQIYSREGIGGNAGGIPRGSSEANRRALCYNCIMEETTKKNLAYSVIFFIISILLFFSLNFILKTSGEGLSYVAATFGATSLIISFAFLVKHFKRYQFFKSLYVLMAFLVLLYYMLAIARSADLL